MLRVLVLAFLAKTAFGFLRASTVGPQNPHCLTNTGLKCAARADCGVAPPGTVGFHQSGNATSSGVGCSGDGKCFCEHGCANAKGDCKNGMAEWFEQELRFGSTVARNYFLTMPAKGAGPPTLKEGYPADSDPESIWLMLLQTDKVTALLSTKQSRYLADGHFLELPEPPYKQKDFVAPIQAKPEKAGSAEWQMEPAPGQGRFRLRHVASDRYLMTKVFKSKTVNRKHAVPVKEEEPVLTTCAAQDCPAGSADWDVWPHTEHPYVEATHKFPPAPWEH